MKADHNNYTPWVIIASEMALLQFLILRMTRV